MRGRRVAGGCLLAAILLLAGAAPIVTPHSPVQQFAGFENAPPMLPHLWGADGAARAVRQAAAASPAGSSAASSKPAARSRYAGSPAAHYSSIDESEGPWLPLGSDPLGRDVLARLLYGARISLAVAAVASLGALLLGVLIGAPAGFAGGRVEGVLMALADFVLVLPAIYVALALRSALPLVLSVGQVFWTLTLVFAILGWPIAARGVRAIIATETKKGVRRSRVRSRGSTVADSATPPAALHPHLPDRLSDAADAGVSPDRGDAHAGRPRIPGSHSDLGRDAARRVAGVGLHRRAMAARPGGGAHSHHAVPAPPRIAGRRGQHVLVIHAFPGS